MIGVITTPLISWSSTLLPTWMKPALLLVLYCACVAEIVLGYVLWCSKTEKYERAVITALPLFKDIPSGVTITATKSSMPLPARHIIIYPTLLVLQPMRGRELLALYTDNWGVIGIFLMCYRWDLCLFEWMDSIEMLTFYNCWMETGDRYRGDNPGGAPQMVTSRDRLCPYQTNNRNNLTRK